MIRRTGFDTDGRLIAIICSSGQDPEGTPLQDYVRLDDLPVGTDRVELAWTGPQFTSRLLVRAHNRTYPERNALIRTVPRPVRGGAERSA